MNQAGTKWVLQTLEKNLERWKVEPSIREGMDSSNTKNSFKNKKDSIYIKEERKPSIIDEELEVGSAWDTGSDDDPHWDTLLG